LQRERAKSREEMITMTLIESSQLHETTSTSAPAAGAPPAALHLRIAAGPAELEATLCLPTLAKGLAILIHETDDAGDGAGDAETRNRAQALIAGALLRADIGALRLHLLTQQESASLRTRQLRLATSSLARRIGLITDAVGRLPQTRDLPLGCFAVGVDAETALEAAAARPNRVAAVVCRDGLLDLHADTLALVRAPTLLIAGAADFDARGAAYRVLSHLHCAKQLKIIPGAGHPFEEPGAAEAVARLAREWFARYFANR
jgi:pimeloyl-ACP methyl ester carboxylesterase